MEIEMRADDGVTPGVSRHGGGNGPRSPVLRKYVEQFANFKPGQSFFVEGVTRKDVEFLRRPFVDAGLGLTMREVEQDEIYGVAGVRVWRLHGDYDATKSQTDSTVGDTPTTLDEDDEL